MPFHELGPGMVALKEPAALPVLDLPAPLSAAPRAPGGSSGAALVRRRFIDEANTSRVPLAAPQGTWSIAQSIALEPGDTPTGLLATMDRLLVLGSDQVALYSSEGEVLLSAMLGPGSPLLVPERGALGRPRRHDP